jgi:CHAD domain-containing protein
MRTSKWKPAEEARADAGRMLPDLVAAYFEAGRKLNTNSNAKAMHRFRLRTKRLRYTLDLFVDLYGPGLKQRSARLRPIQNALGEANDCAMLLKEGGDKLSREMQTWLAARSGEKRDEFLQYWSGQFDAAGEDKKWDRYLKRPARTKTVGS